MKIFEHVRDKKVFTEPSRGMSEAKVEQTSTGQLAPTSNLPQKGGSGINSHTERQRSISKKSSVLFNNFNTPFLEKDFSLFTSHFSLKRCRLMRGDVNKSRRKAAFTLAEVLITLGIIGVVAAITMPTLIQNQQKRSLEVATQKFYSNMSQAVKKYMADEGVDDLRNTPLASDNYGDVSSPEAIASIQNFMIKYLKVVKECDYEANDCFTKIYNKWDGTSPGDEYWSDEESSFTQREQYDRLRDYVLADGAVIRIGYYENNGPIELYVDVNGKRWPNRIGYDLWSMSIFYDGTINESEIAPECKNALKCHSYYYDGDYTISEIRDKRYETCKFGAYGGCFGHFLENGFKFDY